MRVEELRTPCYVVDKELLEKTGGIIRGLSGSPIIQNGKFVGCSNYPKCKYVKKEEKVVIVSEETCPICGKHLVERKDKKGKVFLACSGFPSCKYIKPEVAKTEDEKSEKKCPKCGASLLKKKGKYGYFYGCSNYPKCNYMERISKKKRS